MRVRDNNYQQLTREQKTLLQELGRIGGLKRAANMTPQERREIAVKASKAAAKARKKKKAKNREGV
jgi:hypothetical protein